MEDDRSKAKKVPEPEKLFVRASPSFFLFFSFYSSLPLTIIKYSSSDLIYILFIPINS